MIKVEEHSNSGDATQQGNPVTVYHIEGYHIERYHIKGYHIEVKSMMSNHLSLAFTEHRGKVASNVGVRDPTALETRRRLCAAKLQL